MAKGKRFNEETAREAKKKSYEAHREYKDIQDCFQKNMTDEKRKMLFDNLVILSEKKNLKAMEMLIRYLGEEPAQKIEQTNIDVKVEFEDGID